MVSDENVADSLTVTNRMITLILQKSLITYIFLSSDFIELNIKRTAITKCQCSYPNCRVNCDLKVMSGCLRYEITKKTKVYIPENSRTCENHRELQQWMNVCDDLRKHINKYSAKQIEDMFEFLIDNKEELKKSSISGKL